MRKAQNNLPIQAFTLAIFCLIASAFRLAASSDEARPRQPVKVIQDISYTPGAGGYKGADDRVTFLIASFIKELTQFD